MESKPSKYKRQNAWMNAHRERQTVILPLGTKERVKAAGYTVNGLVNKLLLEELDRIEAEQKQD